MIALRPEQTLRLSGSRVSHIHCHAGVLWITSEGDHRDRFIATGEWLEPGRGLTLVTALEPARLSLSLRPTLSALAVEGLVALLRVVADRLRHLRPAVLKPTRRCL